MTYILGLNCFHADSSAVLMNNGSIVFAIEEERITRLKHWAGFPKLAIRACLDEAGISINDIDHIAINSSPFSNLGNKINYSLSKFISPIYLYERFKNKKDRFSVKNNFIKEFENFSNDIKFHFLEHHLCHMASAYFASNFKEGVVVSIDGFGDFASGAYGYGSGINLKRDKRINFPHSLGQFYTSITQFLGFPNYGDEYKVMGLAPYGEAKYVEQLKEIISWNQSGEYRLNMKYFTHNNRDYTLRFNNGITTISNCFNKNLSKLIGDSRQENEELSQRHFDIAKSTQLVYEQAFYNLLNYLNIKYESKNLCLAGGCAANSVANGKIVSKTNFKSLYVQAAAGDAGGALGAAYLVYKKVNNLKPQSMSSPYLGPSFSNDLIYSALKNISKDELNDKGIKIFKIGDQYLNNESKFLDIIVDALISGLVVGWFQGRMEWGPRALGNRSILGDPRRSDMKDILNLKIKKRESFRPFAPSVLKEYINDWFYVPEDDIDVPYMMKVYKFKFKKDKIKLIPAVCHVDETGRLQTVSKSLNERYFKLIDLFFKKTDVPMLLNTSFNENEPIVCTPKEAIDCFLRTNMDFLAIGDFLLKRNDLI